MISKIIGDIADYLSGLIDVIEGVFSGDLGKVQEGLNKVTDALKDFLANVFQGIIDITIATLSALWDLVKAVFQIIIDAIVNSSIVELFTTVFQAAWDGIVAIFTDLGTWFSDRWTEVTTALSNVGTWFTDMFQKAWNGLTGIFANIGTWFGERWNDVTNALANVATWFGTIFTSAYNAVVNAFSNIGGFFSGVWATVKSIFVNAGQMVGSAVGGAFRSAVNAVLGTIENVVNGFIGMINSVLNTIRSLPGLGWVGSVGYVSLPRLARGGIVDSPTVAMIGEAGKEVVMPLENTGFLQTMGRVVGGAVVNALGGNLTQSSGFSGSGDIVIQIGGHEFGRVAIQEINKEQERAGQVLLNI